MRLVGEMGADASEDRQAARMGYAVAGDPAGALGRDQTMGAEAHQVLAHGRLRTAETSGEFGDLQRPFFEGFDDTEPIGMRQRAEGRGAVTEDLRVKRGRF